MAQIYGIANLRYKARRDVREAIKSPLHLIPLVAIFIGQGREVCEGREDHRSIQGIGRGYPPTLAITTKPQPREKHSRKVSVWGCVEMSTRGRGQPPLPPTVRAQLAQIDTEFNSGELTQRGYELRRSRILSPIDIAALNQSIENTPRINPSAVSLPSTTGS